MPRRLTILIAEDNPADRMLLSTIVSRQGHRVLTAGNGHEAISIFEHEHPQLVLMDALMPVMDGFEAAERIKQLAGDELVPIIFLTSLAENEALVRCLEAGGDDFLSKPYNPIILEAKIQAMGRLRRLQATVRQQRDLIARQNQQLLNEQQVAKAIFDKVAHAGCLDAPNIRYVQSPLALFNGDLLLAAQTPTDRMFVLLGDFTGHGLPAAIGAMPLAETFYGMAAKGYSSGDVLREMNAKLKRILPVGVFCCATLLDISLQKGTLHVWNGGLPDGYVIRADGRHVPLASRHLPLGVVEPGNFDDRFDVVPVQPGDRLLLLSDGVLESRNAQDEMFGEQRLLQVLDDARPSESAIDRIQQALLAFHGQVQDDLSLVEVTLVEGLALTPAPLAFVGTPQPSPLDWSARFELRAETLRNFNPLPSLLQLLLQVHELRHQAGTVYTVLAELYSNALEHGVLRLDSRLKASAKGFSDYYSERQNRLRALSDGHVCIGIDVSHTDTGGRLSITVDDSGPGFDVERVLQAEYRAEGLSGRGIRLIRELADGFSWRPGGRGISVEFRWDREA